MSTSSCTSCMHRLSAALMFPLVHSSHVCCSADELEEMKKHCVAIRVLAHTQISKVALKQKKAHMMEIQVCLIQPH